jgi:hypothetical protein
VPRRELNIITPISLQLATRTSFSSSHPSIWVTNCGQVCRKNGVDILRRVLSSNYAPMFVSVPPKLAICDQLRKFKGHSSHMVQRELPQLHGRYWGRRF